MNTKLTIGAINPGYGGLPIGAAAALGGATIAWHTHPNQTPDCPGRTIMRYHHPYAAAHITIDAAPPMVDVLTINGITDWLHTAQPLIDNGYKPTLVIAEVKNRRNEGTTICEYMTHHGYHVRMESICTNDVGAPHRRPRVYIIAARKDHEAPTANDAYLDADPWTGNIWPTPSAYDTYLDSEAYRWALADMEGKADSRALEHWEKVTGERYPYPLYTLPTSPAPGRLSLGFVEWMMGLPIGYVSTPDMRLTHDQRMGLLYSGTVPLQAAHAVATGLTS